MKWLPPLFVILQPDTIFSALSVAEVPIWYACVELNKLLVPSPQDADLNRDGTISTLENEQTKNNYIKTGWVSGIFKSFGDAPNGFSEELKEVTYAIGTEYAFKEESTSYFL